MNKKTFLMGMLTGALALGAVEGAAIGINTLYEKYSDGEFTDASVAEEEDEEAVKDATAVYAESGNPIIKDTENTVQIEVIPPSGYTISKDYEGAYGAEFDNEDQTKRLEYSIENYTADEMQSYYEFQKELFNSSTDVNYTNVATSEVKTVEVNGYQVNYISLSYTLNGTEDYIEYCAYVMLNDEMEFMCNIYSNTNDINEDMIKECFNSQIPVTK